MFQHHILFAFCISKHPISFNVENEQHCKKALYQLSFQSEWANAIVTKCFYLFVCLFFRDNGDIVVYAYDENDSIQESPTLELEVEAVPALAVSKTKPASGPSIQAENVYETTVESYIVEPAENVPETTIESHIVGQVEVQLERPDTNKIDKQKENQQPNASVTPSGEIQRWVLLFFYCHFNYRFYILCFVLWFT